MDIQKWAEEIQKDVWNEWKRNYNFIEAGFKVFFGPVVKNPKMMIITLNPGGGKERFENEDKPNFENGDFSPPKINAYISSPKPGPMSRNMRMFFSERMDLLENSVAFTSTFFRSKNLKELKKSMEKYKFLEMEYFCSKKVKNIIETLEPKFIFVGGIRTYRKLREVLGLFDEEDYIRSNDRLIAIKSRWNGIKIFTTIHPTGARVKKEDKLKIKELLWKDYENSETPV